MEGFADRGIITPALKCMTVGWDPATSTPIFYAIVETSSGLSAWLTVGRLDFATGIITWTVIESMPTNYQAIEVTDSGMVIAIGGFGNELSEMTYHPQLLPLRAINTYAYTSTESSNHRWDFSTIIRGRPSGGGGSETFYTTDNKPITYFHPETDKVVFATTDGVAVVCYNIPSNIVDVTRTYTELDGSPIAGAFDTFCFDHYHNMLCYGQHADTANLWWRNPFTLSNFSAEFPASNGRYGIRLVTLDWEARDGGQPMFAAMVGDEFIVGLSPAMDDYYYYTSGGDEPILPSYLGNDPLTVPAFGATRQLNTEFLGDGSVFNMRFHYRYKSSSIGKYATWLGDDHASLSEIKLPERNNE